MIPQDDTQLNSSDGHGDKSAIYAGNCSHNSKMPPNFYATKSQAEEFLFSKEAPSSTTTLSTQLSDDLSSSSGDLATGQKTTLQLPTFSIEPNTRNVFDFFLEPRLSEGAMSIPDQAKARKYLKFLIWVPIITMASMLFGAFYWIPLFQQKGCYSFVEKFFWDTIVLSRLYLAILVVIPMTIGILSDILNEITSMVMLLRGKRRRVLNPNQPRLYHAVIICNYKEPIDVLRATIQSIEENTLSNRCIVILACEDRDKESEAVFAELESEFHYSFRNFVRTAHVLTDGEVAGKSSNENHACRELSKLIRTEGIDPFQVMVTTCDADSLFDRVYFEQVEAEFGRMVDGRRFIYNAPINTYRNLPECHLVVKHFEIERCQHDCFNAFGFRPAQSNYSLTLGFAEEINYWDPTNTSEDLHTTLKAMAATGKAESIMVPIWSLIFNDSVCSFNDRWVQAKRHMWGIEEVVFVLQLFPVIRINQWAKMMSRVTLQMFGSCTPPFLMLFVPTVRAAFFALREDTQKLLIGLFLARLLYSWAKTYLRELFLYKFIIGDRPLMMKRTIFEWIQLALTWPICSQFGLIVFASGATWRMLLHAVRHETLAYVTAPKALSLAQSSGKPKKSM